MWFKGCHTIRSMMALLLVVAIHHGHTMKVLNGTVEGYDASLVIIAQLDSKCHMQRGSPIDVVVACRSELHEFILWAAAVELPVLLEPSRLPYAAFKNSPPTTMLIRHASPIRRRASATFQRVTTTATTSITSLDDFYDVELLSYAWNRIAPAVAVTELLPKSSTIRARASMTVHRRRNDDQTLPTQRDDVAFRQRQFLRSLASVIEPARTTGATHLVVPVLIAAKSEALGSFSIEHERDLAMTCGEALEPSDDIASVASVMIQYLVESMPLQRNQTYSSGDRSYCALCLPSQQLTRAAAFLNNVDALLDKEQIHCDVFVLATESEHESYHLSQVQATKNVRTLKKVIEEVSRINVMIERRRILSTWTDHRLAHLELEVLSAAQYFIGSSARPMCQHVAAKRHLFHSTTFESHCLTTRGKPRSSMKQAAHRQEGASVAFDDGCSFLLHPAEPRPQRCNTTTAVMRHIAWP